MAEDMDRGRGIPQDCGVLPFLIRRDGVWLYRGEPILRKPMVCLFSQALTRDVEGAFWLQTPAERGVIAVEDAPFIVVELEWSGSGRGQSLCFRTNTDQMVTAAPDHPIRAFWDLPPDAADAVTSPYLHLRDGDGRYPIEARISRSVWYELAALAEPGCHQGIPCLGVWSEGCFFPLSRLSGSCRDQEDEHDGLA